MNEKSQSVRLRLAGVSKRYAEPGGSAPLEILRDINLVVCDGDALAVVGPSGSGKTTLLNLMGAMDRPTSGRIELGGRDISALSDSELAGVRNREIGFVFQGHHLLPQCTVLENVLVPTLADAFPKPERPAAARRARQLLQDLGLGPRLNHLPGELSGGECQRVAVARALVNEPALLLADEPTGSLDYAAAEKLADLLAQLNRERGVTLVVVTHAAAVADRMARRYALADGQLAPRG